MVREADSSKHGVSLDMKEVCHSVCIPSSVPPRMEFSRIPREYSATSKNKKKLEARDSSWSRRTHPPESAAPRNAPKVTGAVPHGP